MGISMCIFQIERAGSLCIHYIRRDSWPHWKSRHDTETWPCALACRSGGDRGGGADRAAAEPAEPGAGQSLLCQRAACTKGKIVIWFICWSWISVTTLPTRQHKHLGINEISFPPLWFRWPRLLSSIFQVSRVIQLRPDGRLEQTVSMATDNEPLMQHLHITYRRQAAFT